MQDLSPIHIPLKRPIRKLTPVSHVQDLSEGHLSALDYAKAQGSHGGFSVFNLGKETHLLKALEGQEPTGI